MEAVLGEHSPRIQIDGHLVEASTRIVAAGGYVLNLATVLTRSGIELHSTYTGHPHADRTLISELFMCPQRPPLIETRDADPCELPVLYDRQSCLYDHLLRLHELLSGLGLGQVVIDGLGGALEALRP